MLTVDLVSPRGNPLLKMAGDVSGIAVSADAAQDAADYATEMLRYLDTVEAEFAGMEGQSVQRVFDDAANIRDSLFPCAQKFAELSLLLSDYSASLDEAQQALDPLVEPITEAEQFVQKQKTIFEDAAANGKLLDELIPGAYADSLEQDYEQAKQELADLWAKYDSAFSTWKSAYDLALNRVALISTTGSPIGALGVGETQIELLLTGLVNADPARVERYWNLLSDSQKSALIARYPTVVGNLEGVPYSVRQEVNLDTLRDAKALGNAHPHRQEIEALWQQIEAGGNLVSLRLDAHNQPTAVLSFGDVSTASKVNVMAPGMMSTLNDIGPWSESARTLNADVTAANSAESSATLVFFGYDSPNVAEEPSQSHANEGAAQFSNFIGGLALERSASSELSVIAHSYGSTMTGEAIGSDPDNLGVDRFITVGSAGLATPVTSEPGDSPLHFGSTAVFATAAEGDLLAEVGQATSKHSFDPRDLPGAVEFQSDGWSLESNEDVGAPPSHGEPVTLLGRGSGHDVHHSLDFFEAYSDALAAEQAKRTGNVEQVIPRTGYLDQNSESFFNIVEIVANGSPWTVVEKQ